MSPPTKILVSQLCLTIEYGSPSVSWMMRPSCMYIVAAKRAGATRTSMVSTMYGPRVQFGVCLQAIARAM